MKANFIISIMFSTVLWFGCEGGDTGPRVPPTSGTVTLDSRYINNQASGFSFDQATIVKFPNSSNTLPDLTLLVLVSSQGVSGTFFCRPDSLVPSFQLLSRFKSLDSARSYFQSLSEIPDTSYEDLALPLEVAEIWAVKTRRDTYAKILITETIAYADSSNPSSPTPYGEATFDWAYQPNGTRVF